MSCEASAAKVFYSIEKQADWSELHAYCRTDSIEYAGPPDDLQEHSIQDAKLGGAATGGGDSTHGLRFPLIAKRLACMVAFSATAEHVLNILTHMNLSQGIIPDEVCLSPPPSLLPKR
ncbi:unnamed protein product [Sphagnum jensenii]|uniref:Uncharacterized protein n=1 Tax=Sphagnum jensenii TaxID=128206 RepID=A0ABP1AFW6_9BRYO